MTTTTIEINGVKMEVDLRHAKRVETLRIGDRVRCLTKDTYSTSHQVYPGVIVGFEPFDKLPSIVVCYLDSSTLKTRTVNTETKDFEIIAAIDDTLLLEREHVVDLMQREIARKEIELTEAKRKLEYFERMFGRWFGVEQARSQDARAEVQQ